MQRIILSFIWGIILGSYSYCTPKSANENERDPYVGGPIEKMQLIPETEPLDTNISILNNGTGIGIEITNSDEGIEGYKYKSDSSPDNSVKLESEALDHGVYSVIVKFDTVIHKLKDVYASPHEYYWSKTGKYAVLNNKDYYADAGSFNIFVLNVLTGKYISLSSVLIMDDINTGKREKLNIQNINWLDSVTFTIQGNVSYLGESGHPGINSNRKAKLGENMGNTTDTVPLSNRKFKIVNDNSKDLLVNNIPIIKNIPLKDYDPSGPVDVQKIDHYICYRAVVNGAYLNIWISFTENNNAIELKYEGQKSTIQLVFEKEEIYKNGAVVKRSYKEIINGKISGLIKLSHGEDWDYAVYTRAKDLKEFHFSNHHKSNPYYVKVPCF